MCTAVGAVLPCVTEGVDPFQQSTAWSGTRRAVWVGHLRQDVRPQSLQLLRAAENKRLPRSGTQNSR